MSWPCFPPLQVWMSIIQLGPAPRTILLFRNISPRLSLRFPSRITVNCAPFPYSLYDISSFFFSIPQSCTHRSSLLLCVVPPSRPFFLVPIAPWCKCYKSLQYRLHHRVRYTQSR